MRYFSSFINHHSLIIILVLALILRLINLDQSLWWDEAINVVYAKSTPFWWFVTKYPVGDFHPPGWFAILWVWGHLFSFGEFIIRLPSVIFGLLTIFLTYLVGKKLYSKQVGLMAALFMSLAPLHIYYSQEARMYSFVAFAVTLSSYFLLRLIKKEKFSLFGYGLSLILVLYSDYVAYLVLPAHTLYISIYYRNLLKKYISSVILGIVPFLIWLPIFPEQLKNGIEKSNIVSGWRNVVGGVGMKEAALLPVKILLGRINFENKLIYTLLLGFALAPYLFAFKKILNSLGHKVNYLIFWILIPTALAFVISFFIPIFNYFRLLFILPAFYILIALGLDKYRFNHRILLIILIIVFEVFTSGVYLFNHKFHREDWKNAVSFINKNSDDKTLTLHKNNEIPAPFMYYQFNLEALPAFKKIPADSTVDLNDLEKNLTPYNKIFLFNYLVDITDPNLILEKEIEKLGFEKVNDYDFRGIGFVKLYVK